MGIMRSLLSWFAGRKTMPAALSGTQWSGTAFVDAFKRNRNPTPNELMAELKNTAYACIAINSAVCASNPPSLYVVTHEHQPRPKCLTKALRPEALRKLRENKDIPTRISRAKQIDEVVEHPLLDLLRRVNPVHNAYDLWELTTLYQEVHGLAYWYISTGPLGIPDEIWPLPTQNVSAKRNPGSANVVDYYVYRTGATEQVFKPEQIICFR
jgi:hypothetical protein